MCFAFLPTGDGADKGGQHGVGRWVNARAADGAGSMQGRSRRSRSLPQGARQYVQAQHLILRACNCPPVLAA